MARKDSAVLDTAPISETVIQLLQNEADRLHAKAKRQGEAAQVTLDNANSVSKAIKELSPPKE